MPHIVLWKRPGYDHFTPKQLLRDAIRTAIEANVSETIPTARINKSVESIIDEIYERFTEEKITDKPQRPRKRRD
jgi:mannitol-1-phosphate/altronate dehydrogenase